MKCSEERLNAMLDKELSPAQEAELREHVAQCAHCQQSLAVLQGVNRLLGGLMLQDLPAGINSAILRRTSRNPLSRFIPVAAAACALIAFGLGLRVAQGTLPAGLFSSYGTYAMNNSTSSTSVFFNDDLATWLEETE